MCFYRESPASRSSESRGKMEPETWGWIIAAFVLLALFRPVIRVATDALNRLSFRLDRKRCPQCAETVKKAAKICPFCRSEFPASTLPYSFHGLGGGRRKG